MRCATASSHVATEHANACLCARLLTWCTRASWQDEAKIYAILKNADRKNSGNLSSQELYRAVGDLVKVEKTSSQRKHLLIAAVVACVAMLATNIGLTAGVVLYAKDTKVSSNGELVTSKGNPVQVASARGAVSLFDYPHVEDAELASFLETPLVLRSPTNPGDSMLLSIVECDRTDNGKKLVMRSAGGRMVHLEPTSVRVYSLDGTLLLEYVAPAQEDPSGRKLYDYFGYFQMPKCGFDRPLLPDA